MPISKTRTKILALLGISFIGLSACTVIPQAYSELRYETAKRLAMPAFMLERRIKTETYTLTSFERIHNRGGYATIYIDGDGLNWSGTETDSHNPTPVNPVALHLATRDNSKNVIYLARPCHYTALRDGNMCTVEGWTSNRFAPESVKAMNDALDNIKNKYGVTSFNLVGYDGGATMAAIIASERDDIDSFRSVAGKLDYNVTNYMKDETLDDFDATDIARKIAYIPQHHFIGEWDEKTPSTVFDAFAAASGNSDCVKASIVKEATHDKGWVSKWPELLKAPLNCNSE